MLSEELRNNINNQDILNEFFTIFCDEIRTEMDKHLNIKFSNDSKKQTKICKPYWNQELNELWQEMNKNEKIYISFKRNTQTNKFTDRNLLNVRRNLIQD